MAACKSGSFWQVGKPEHHYLTVGKETQNSTFLTTSTLRSPTLLQAELLYKSVYILSMDLAPDHCWLNTISNVSAAEQMSLMWNVQVYRLDSDSACCSRTLEQCRSCGLGAVPRQPSCNFAAPITSNLTRKCFSDDLY